MTPSLQYESLFIERKVERDEGTDTEDSKIDSETVIAIGIKSKQISLQNLKMKTKVKVGVLRPVQQPGLKMKTAAVL